MGHINMIDGKMNNVALTSLSLRLVRNPSLKERFPTSGNDISVTLLME